MKTLKEHVILYDAVCPMCNIYTKGFIKAGMLDADGRQPYQDLHGDLKKLVDCRRAVNEIALVNKNTGVVHYGVQSLFLIIENSFPLFKPLFRWKPFGWLADKAYKFVSFNRRVIVPSRLDLTNGADQPLFRFSYRFAYLLATCIVTALILNHYSKLMLPLMPAGSFYREFLMCGGQLVWQGLVMMALNRSRLWDYLGNMMTISFAGSLMLLLSMGILKSLAVGNPLVYAGSFALVVGLMFFEHIRRTKLLGLSSWLTASWVLYRIVLLAVIL